MNKVTSKIRKMNPVQLIAVLCAVVFVVLSVLYGSPVSNKENSFEARTAIVLETSESGAGIYREGEYIAAYEGMRLIDGDVLVTEKDATLCLKISDGETVLVDEESRLNISELKNGKLCLKLVEGNCCCFDEDTKENIYYSEGSTAMTVRDSGIVEGE